jgi:tRNA U34 5-methylaminomethyl-2-thiouridine-forming methyltransferase MnmC
MHDRMAKLDWRDGKTPVSQDFDDPYFSLDDGVAETQHVFLAGNDLPTRFKDGFHIAELGFGTGLNLCVALASWHAMGQNGPLTFTSFEAFPMAPDDMRRALGHLPDVAHLAEPVIEALSQGKTNLTSDDLIFSLVLGDARETLPVWNDHADAWFLDGFSPAKNPELWDADLMQAVFDHTAPNGTAATYAAAGFVRRNLTDAGFEVDRSVGFGRKRHMTQARRT